MKTKFTLLAVFAAYSLSAQVIGDPQKGSYDFTNDQLYFPGSTSQYYPKVFVENGESSVLWGEGVSGDVGVYHIGLDNNYSAQGQIDTAIEFTGVLNSDGDALNHSIDYDANTSKFLSVFRFADNINVAQKDFSLQAKLYESSDFSGTPFYIEGPFDYVSDMPNRPDVAANGNGQFCVAYHSNSGFSTSSVIRIKMVDASNGTVTPAPTANTQTGTAVTVQGAQHPSVAWNEDQGVYGIVYVTGSANNAKIKFVSVNTSGTVVTSEKDVLNDNGITYQWPQIQADGDGFVITWQDFRGVHVTPETSISGIPHERIALLTGTGDIKSLTGPAELFDANDNSLMISNPYFDGSYINHDLITVSAGEKYGVVWATQDSPTKVQFAEVYVDNGAISSMVPVEVNQSEQISDKPTLAYDGSKYIITYDQYNGTKYENRIAVGTYNSDPVSTTSLNENNMESFTIYPNPTADFINFNTMMETVTIFNSTGQFVKRYHQVQSIDVRSFDNGIYFISSANGHTEKVMIMK